MSQNVATGPGRTRTPSQHHKAPHLRFLAISCGFLLFRALLALPLPHQERIDRPRWQLRYKFKVEELSL